MSEISNKKMSDAPVKNLLIARKLTRRFGGLMAIDSVDLTVKSGEIVSLIGPNGAGKTTFFNCITGMHEPTSGEILFFGENGENSLGGLKPHEVTRLGLARTFQNIRLFSNMTALENIMVGEHCRTRAGVLSAVIRTPFVRNEEKNTEQNAAELLAFVGLSGMENELANNLPYGLQRRLEIARAMATRPLLLLLDEPAAGMNPQETAQLMRLIHDVRDRGISVLLIEHHMQVVMGISDRVYVLDHGVKIAEGTPAEIQSNEHVIAAYLGREV